LDSATKVKSILITGCSTGIGLHLARELKKLGYRVFASARKQADVIELESEGFESLLLDLSSSDSINSAVSDLFQKTDTLYALINNGAYGQVGALEDISRAAMEAQFQANFFGWHELTNLILPSMKKSNTGRLIYISSVLGFVALPFRGPYIASKFAIEGLVDTLRLELRHTNIKLSLVQPGPIESDFRKNAYLAFQKYVDFDKSDYQKDYERMIERLSASDNAKFTLGAEAVLKPVQHALTSNSPKVRYRVTFPTKLFAILGRILPSGWLDKILTKAAD